MIPLAASRSGDVGSTILLLVFVIGLLAYCCWWVVSAWKLDHYPCPHCRKLLRLGAEERKDGAVAECCFCQRAFTVGNKRQAFDNSIDSATDKVFYGIVFPVGLLLLVVVGLIKGWGFIQTKWDERKAESAAVNERKAFDELTNRLQQDIAAKNLAAIKAGKVRSGMTKADVGRSMGWKFKKHRVTDPEARKHMEEEWVYDWPQAAVYFDYDGFVVSCTDNIKFNP